MCAPERADNKCRQEIVTVLSKSIKMDLNGGHGKNEDSVRTAARSCPKRVPGFGRRRSCSQCLFLNQQLHLVVCEGAVEGVSSLSNDCH
jgi:hypothetical protein